VESSSNTSAVTLRVVGGDEKGSLKSESVIYVGSRKGLGPEKDCPGKSQERIQKTYPPSHLRGRPTKTRPQLSNSKKYLFMSPDGARHQGLLTDWSSVAMWLWLWLLDQQKNVRNIGKCEAWRRKYKRLKLGGGQAYDRSSDYTAVLAGATNDLLYWDWTGRGPVYVVYTRTYV
jgi:hypothetical protein